MKQVLEQNSLSESVKHISPQTSNFGLTSWPDSVTSDWPSRGYWGTTPGRDIWGSDYVQNSDMLKHLPSRLTTKTPITQAAEANTVNLKLDVCKIGGTS